METNKKKVEGRSRSAFMRSSSHRQKAAYIGMALVLMVLCGLAIARVVSQSSRSDTIQVADSPVVREYRSKLPGLKADAQKKPTNYGARQAYAQALYVTGDKKAAKVEYEAAVKLNAKDATIRNNLGNTYRDLGDYVSAATSYKAAINLDPAMINAYVNLATMQAYTLQRPADAVATYKLAVSKNAQSPELLLLLGGAYEQDGQKDLALSAYRSVLAKDSNNTAAKRNIDRLTK